MTLARLYGSSIGWGSMRVVTEGFRQALTKAGVFAGFCAVDQGFESDLDSTAGVSAKHGIFVGPLHLVGKMFQEGNHQHYWVMVIPNSDELPSDLVQQLKGYARKHTVHWMTPSVWAMTTIHRLLGECLCVPLGVSDAFRPDREGREELIDLYRSGEFRVLHFSTSARARKGTIELLQAWSIYSQRQAPMNRRLLCVMDYAAKAALEDAIVEGAVEDWLRLKQSVTLADRAEFPPDLMARSLARTHVVCQPSRGEGFGLIPLQALLVGTPVAITDATGHQMYTPYMDRGHPALIPVGPLGPIDDLPGSLAPTVDPLEIAYALMDLESCWEDCSSRAQRTALDRGLWERFSWEHQLAQLVQKLREC